MPEPIFEDPVVAEIHAIRAQLLANCGGDMEQLMQQSAQRQRESAHPIITKPYRSRTVLSHALDSSLGAVANPAPLSPAR
jgi:hypothetical protein